MFSRWSQENFFRYMKEDFDFDKMWQYGTVELSHTMQIVNPDYRVLVYQIKKIREKISRQKAQLANHLDEIINKTIDKTPKYSLKQLTIIEKIETLKEQESLLLKQREQTAHKITLADMPKEKRYNQLKAEHKHFINIIKMISYRAETSLLQTLKPFTNPINHEERMILKQLFTTPADIIPDYKNNTLTIKIKGLSANRYNKAIIEMLKELNETKTIYPQTNLLLIYEM